MGSKKAMAMLAAMGMAAGLASPVWAQTANGESFTPSAADQRRLIASIVAASPTTGLNLQNLGAFGAQIDKLLALGIPADAIVAQLRRGSAQGAAAPGSAAFLSQVRAAEQAQSLAAANAAAAAERKAALSSTVERLKAEQAAQARMLASGGALGVDDVRARLFASTGGAVKEADVARIKSQFAPNPDGSQYSVSTGGQSGDDFYASLYGSGSGSASYRAPSTPAPATSGATSGATSVDEVRARLFASTGGAVKEADVARIKSQFIPNPDGSQYSVSTPGQSGDDFYDTSKW